MTPTRTTHTRKSYLAVIRREPRFTVHGDCYVARNEEGGWVAYGKAADAPAASGRKLAEWIFHRDEIASVQVLGKETWVTIKAE